MIKIKIFFPLALFSLVVLGLKNNGSNIQESRNGYLQYDTSSAKLKDFKIFSKKFFSAARSSDTAFLKAHVIFPISNSSFYIFDESLLHKKLDSKMFFRRLNKLFPADLIKRIDKEGKFSYSITKGAPKTFIIIIYNITDGIEGNESWIFLQKNNDFYFLNFMSEAG